MKYLPLHDSLSSLLKIHIILFAVKQIIFLYTNIFLVTYNMSLKVSVQPYLSGSSVSEVNILLVLSTRCMFTILNTIITYLGKGSKIKFSI